MGKNMADVLLKITTIAFLEQYSLIPYQYKDAQKRGFCGISKWRDFVHSKMNRFRVSDRLGWNLARSCSLVRSGSNPNIQHVPMSSERWESGDSITNEKRVA